MLKKKEVAFLLDDLRRIRKIRSITLTRNSPSVLYMDGQIAAYETVLNPDKGLQSSIVKEIERLKEEKKEKNNHGNCPKCKAKLEVQYYYPDVGATDGIVYCPKCSYTE